MLISSGSDHSDIEMKNSEVDIRVGLPQLLFYMQSFLERQPLVWGLVTNGEMYLSVRLVVGRFLLLPYFVVSSLRQTERVLEVLIAIGTEEVVSKVE